jgi:hypothetical protein
MAQVSSATDTTPIFIGWPGVEYASAIPPSACAIESVPGRSACGPLGPYPEIETYTSFGLTFFKSS